MDWAVLAVSPTLALELLPVSEQVTLDPEEFPQPELEFLRHRTEDSPSLMDRDKPQPIYSADLTPPVPDLESPRVKH